MDLDRKRTKKRINDDKRKRCGRKVKFRTLAEAEFHANIIRMKDGFHSSAYLCPYCRFYHAGHTPYKVLAEAAEALIYGD
jgi:hypothetical protein